MNTTDSIRFYAPVTGFLSTGMVLLADGSEALGQVVREGGAWSATIDGANIARQTTRHATKSAAKNAVREALRAA